MGSPVPPPPSDDDVIPDPLVVPDNPIAVPEDSSEGGKLKMIVQLVKRSLGVKDIAAMYVHYTVSGNGFGHSLTSKQAHIATRVSPRAHSQPRILDVSR